MKSKYKRRDFLKKSSLAIAGLTYLVSPLSIFAATQPEKEYDFSKDSEEKLMAKMIYGEGREFLWREDQREAAMICFTPINRAKDKIKRNGTTIKEAILRKNPRIKNSGEMIRDNSGKIKYGYQYNCFSPKDVNFKELINPEAYDPKSWERAQSLSKKILEGKLTHLNYGQSHYYAKDTPTPSWANDPRMKKVWGKPFFKHEFYRDTKA